MKLYVYGVDRRTGAGLVRLFLKLGDGMKRGTRGIDLSFHNGKPDWNEIKTDFAILAVTSRWGDDCSFEHNYDGAAAHGIKVGCYKFSYAKTKRESRQEAKKLLEALKGRKLDLPIFLDLEWEEQRTLPEGTLYKIARVFEKAVKAAGYKFGIYCNLDWYRNTIPEKLKNRRFWIASYPKKDDGAKQDYVEPSEVKNLYCWQYSEKGRMPGVAGDVDLNFWYGKPKSGQRRVTAQMVLSTAASYIGTVQGDDRHRKLVDTYNAHEPLAQGYKVKYSDSWCAVFVSDCFIFNSADDLIGGTECGVQRFVELFKTAGIWEEAGDAIVSRGDIIVFDWDHGGFADHIGLVEEAEGSSIRTIEGNASGAVRRRTYQAGDPAIKGYAHPRYTYPDIFEDIGAEQALEDLETIASQVIAGEWGNNPERAEKLEAAGYDPEIVQELVNRRYKQ